MPREIHLPDVGQKADHMYDMFARNGRTDAQAYQRAARQCLELSTSDSCGPISDFWSDVAEECTRRAETALELEA